jgi:hypothetical protein
LQSAQKARRMIAREGRTDKAANAIEVHRRRADRVVTTHRSKVHYRTSLADYHLEAMRDDVLKLLHGHGPNGICGQCISSLLGDGGSHLYEAIMSLEKERRILLAVAVCDKCGERVPTYRLAGPSRSGEAGPKGK